MQYQDTSDLDPKHIQSKEFSNSNLAIGHSGIGLSGDQQPLLQADTKGQVEDAEAKKKKYIKWGIISGIALIVIILAIVLPLTLGGGGNNPPGPGPNPPNPPLPGGGSNPYLTSPGSMKSSASGTMVSGLLTAKISEIETFNKHAVENIVPKSFLELIEKDTVTAANVTQKGVDWREKNFFGSNNQITNNVNYLIDMPDYRMLRLVMSDANQTRFSIPDSMVNMPQGGSTMRLEMLGVTLSQGNQTFGFQMCDVLDNTNWYLDTRNQALIFSDKYIQMDVVFPSQNLYGLGDRVHEFKLTPGAYSLWSSGQDPQYDIGVGRGGLSGVHPFLMVETKKARRYIGIYIRNSAAMTPIIRFNNDGTSTVSLITIGGQIEFYVIGMGTAHQVIQYYQSMVINKAALPPYWSLGWQEASPYPLQGKSEQDSLIQAVTNYVVNKFPLEAVYLQQDSWDQTKDFALDASKISDVNQIKNTLGPLNIKLVAYIDPAVKASNRANNPTYQAGASADAFIKSTIYSNNPGSYLVNQRNGKNVVYPDWMNDKCMNFWSAQVSQYQQSVPFDGLWTTMNEPFGEISGEVSTTSLQESIDSPDYSVQVGDNQTYDQSWFFTFYPLYQNSTYLLPFVPQFTQVGNYDKLSLSLNSTHNLNGKTVKEYDTHSLYAHGMMKATQDGAKKNSDNRPFILTRGSFAGTGQYAPAQAHTNNERTWDSLYLGLASVLRSQMFGMPLSGTDVCGYKSGTDTVLDEELCLRWYQLATFFPLARHSQSTIGVRTEPYMFNTYKQQVLKTMHDRMQYLRLLYTCMFEVSDSGGTCLDPVHFRYSVSPNAYLNSLPDVTTQYIVAGSLLVSPIMNKTNNAKNFAAYFPKGQWVNMADWSEVITGSDGYLNLTVRDTVNVHLAPGAMIPFQDNSDMSIMTTADSLNKTIKLVANRDSNGVAGGSLMLDKGQTRSEMDNLLYEYYDINLQAKSIQVSGAGFNKGTQPHILDEIVVVNAADLEYITTACYFSPSSLTATMMQVSYDGPTKSLHIKPMSQTKFSEILNVYFSGKGDLNMCTNATSQSHSFNYNIEGGVIPLLNNTKHVSINLTHMAGTLDDLTLDLGFFDQGILNVRWSWRNATGKRFVTKVPDTLVNSTARDTSAITETLSQYVEIRDRPFQLIFKRRVTSTKYENVLSLQGFLYDEYLNWVNLIANAQASATEDSFQGIFGLGERASTDFFFKSGVYSMWNKDIDNPTENGKLPGKEVYGTHPFYMFKHAANSWVGVYHNLAQAQDWWITNDYKSGNVSLSQISTGGYGDLYIFVSAQSPENIISKYFNLVGTPVLTPQWALGWNQCKWCYQSLADVQASTQGYIDNGIPLDTQWVDIDYMQDYKDFTVNEVDFLGNPGSFYGLSAFVDKLHNMNMHFVPIVDAGISARPNEQYDAYQSGIQQDVFMKLGDGSLSVGKVWPNEAVYPDFLAPNTDGWWGQQLSKFHQNLKFDGLWQDMNEASNFCNGPCQSDVETYSNSIEYKLPYTPTGQSLQTKAVNLNVQQAQNYTQLDAHSLFGALQVRSSSLWFKNNGTRPMIISRSSFAGMGKYGSKWLGDNHAQQIDMEESVIGIMKMNMFGITLIGADICGFAGPATTPDLCARWHQIGAFQPFSRNHRVCDNNPQEPWRFKNIMFDATTSYMDIMKSAIYRKYHLMRYYYTQMSAVAFGNATYQTAYKPLFFEFPEDTGAYMDIANNVMIGSALKTSINVKDQSQNMTNFYFPKGTWCSLFAPNVGDCITATQSQNFSLSSRVNESYVHLREGYVVPMQDATAIGARTTKDLQSHPVDLHILGTYRVPGVMSWTADGDYINDDGLTTVLAGNVNQYHFRATYTQTQGEVLTIQVNNAMTASNYFDNTTLCAAVNSADFLGTIYVYNALAFKKNDVYFVQVAYEDDIDTYITVGSATFDPVTNRIVTTLEENLCLTRVFRITIRNLNTSAALSN